MSSPSDADGAGREITREDVYEAARLASGAIIHMVLASVGRRQVRGFPMWDDRMIGWDDYVAKVVMEQLDANAGRRALTAGEEG
jgi:hypothetical protein